MIVPRPILQRKPATRPFPGGRATFWQAGPFASVLHFYLDVLDGDQVLPDQDGIDFADLNTTIAEAVAGARDLVAHGIMQNQDVSGQRFLIRDNHGETVATVPFRDTLPGKLRGRSLAYKPLLALPELRLIRMDRVSR